LKNHRAGLWILWTIGALADSLRFIPQAIPLRPLAAAEMIMASLAAMGVMVGAGLWAARRVGLGSPLLEAALEKERIGSRLRGVAPLAVALGVGSSLVVMGLNLLLFKPLFLVRYGAGAAAMFSAASHPAAWLGIFASIHGGIVEEIVFRLFLMSVFAWLLALVWKNAGGGPKPAVFWLANLGAAVLFGLAHVSNATRFVPLSGLVLARALVLNGIAAIVLGWLYWRKGLEAAMLAHFCADLVVHVVFVAL
jgi:membrane protease YdiL (CAAX protease family)